MKTLANDLTRRLLNTSESLGIDERITVIDDYGHRMLNSGFGITQSQKIVLNGIKDHERKLRESRKINGRKLHRTALESSGHRSRKKLLDKTEWFKKRRRVQDDEEQKPQKPWQPKNNTRDRKEQIKLQSSASNPPTISSKIRKTRTVLFVDQTPEGRLAKDLREVLTRLENILGFKVKVVERTGTSLRNCLPNTNPWSGTRQDCVTCNQA